MKIKVRAFGPLLDIMENEYFIEASDTKALLDVLLQQFPGLAGRKIAIAVNGKITSDMVSLQDQDTVALLPPYSGG
ncbi:MoaD/ThiS family protein [Sphingobacterium pedocola]|uniref:Molybdopterin synthase sulfur carrier subunit n=1 Tax=Sphingobacterium pedocola TaxID=2082722 RepID=A0ABR9T556_9SPHI|nr:MoaD/ThiS family protein [Sphingobacterium pedocola]MBE8720473.1 molybdopterin synthase sulfur carrier subunit [Sphingobacterium pedocola]